MTCELCASLVIDYGKYEDDIIPTAYFVAEEYPRLTRLTKSANDGCEFCNLLGQLLREYFDVTESGLEKPVQFQLRHARFYTQSHYTVMSEEEEHSDKNRVYGLVVDVAYYQNLSKSRELLFDVFLNDDCE